MVDFFDYINEKINQTGMQQKQIAASFLKNYQNIEQIDGVGKESLTETTIAPKLSQLTNREREGVKFFFSDEYHILSLAQSLSIPRDELKQRYDEFMKCKILVLDPRLSSNIMDFLCTQQSAANGTYYCERIEILNDDNMRNILKKAALKYQNSLIVTNTQGDMDFYEGASVLATLCKRVPRGWRLCKEPELIPIPPPNPPKLFDEKGNPLAPFPELTERYTKGYSDGMYNQREIKNTLERGETPTYRVVDIIRWLPDTSRPYDLFSSRFSIETTKKPSIYECLDDDKNTIGRVTYVWVEDRQIFAFGPHRCEIEKYFADYHQVRRPNVEQCLERLSSLNPYNYTPNCPHFDSSRVERISKEIAESCGGLDISGYLASWAQKKTTTHPLDKKMFGVKLNNISDELKNKEEVLNFLNREFNFEYSQMWILHLLRHIFSRPIILLVFSEKNQLHITTNLGAGHIVYLIFSYYEKEEPCLVYVAERTHLQTSNRLVLNGGDVSVWMEFTYQPLLEGSTFFPILNKNQKNASYDDGLLEGSTFFPILNKNQENASYDDDD